MQLIMYATFRTRRLKGLRCVVCFATDRSNLVRSMGRIPINQGGLY